MSNIICFNTWRKERELKVANALSKISRSLGDKLTIECPDKYKALQDKIPKNQLREWEELFGKRDR